MYVSVSQQKVAQKATFVCDKPQIVAFLKEVYECF